MWQWLLGHAGFSFPDVWTQGLRARFPSPDRKATVVLLRDQMLDYMLVFQNRPLGTKA